MMADESAKKRYPDVLKNLEVVANRWQVIRTLGKGGFGAVYEVLDMTTRRVEAMKVELQSQPFRTLKLEVYVLRELNAKNARHVCKIIGLGKLPQFTFIVMTLVGPSISNLLRSLRSKFPNGQPHFTLRTSLFLAIQTLEALQDLHNSGFIHRDVKPQNFAIGRPPNYRDVYLIDFGMCRRFLKNGVHRRPRQKVGFRGTLYYASVDALRGREQSRKEDMWSWAFMLVRITVGAVPWRKFIVPRHVRTVLKARTYAQCKTELLANLTRFLEGCPPEYKTIYEHLNVLTYYDKPNYEMCYEALRGAMKRMKYSDKEPLDWEAKGEHHEVTEQADVHGMVQQKAEEDADRTPAVRGGFI